MSRRAIGASLLVVILFAGEALGQPCLDGEWCQWRDPVFGNGHVYKVVVVPTPINWSDAQNDAVAEGGYLATITSAEENEFVCNLAKSNPDAWDPVLTYGPWIGGFQDPADPLYLEPAGGWVWVTGEPADYWLWNNAEPNDLGGEDRLHYHFFAAEVDCSWNDLADDTNDGIISYIIERESCPEGVWCQWTAAEGGDGHWYRFTATNPTWEANEEEAVAAGGHLVAIGSQAENDWILAKFGTENVGHAIGFHQLPGSVEPAEGWVWTTQEAVGYTNWRICCPLEPNNLNGGEDVAYMHWPNHPDAGTWYDAPSSVSQGIIERTTEPGAIPTVSEWGVAVMTLLLLSAGTVVFRGRRAVVG